ncbi:hypothetical protein LCGC14_1382540 [marine sediment metagenome]|uniref:Uncharacterized protein n=1 Tax=marine sediment metagenome TaxID=412755 RepID=A0A0F9K2H5_9ZZZZ
MSNHFNYLLSEQDVTPSVSADRLLLMAKTASRRYLHDGTPLNDTIRKLASENDLNQNQINRVCEMANISTHRTLWPSATEKEKVAFQVATPKMIVIGLRPRSAPMSGGGCRSSIGSDYMSPPSLPLSGPSMSELFGGDGGGHQGMHGDSDRKTTIIIMQKKAEEKKCIESDLIVETMRWESEKLAAYNAVKQEVLGGTSLSDIQDAVYAAGLGKYAAYMLPEFHQSLIAETHGLQRLELEKVAIAPAPEEYISANLGNTTVVNGAHPVLISLDTLHKRDGKIRALLTGLNRVNDELVVYGQKIREMQ